MLKYLLIILSGLLIFAIPTMGQVQQPTIETITLRQDDDHIVVQVFGNVPPINCNTTFITVNKQGTLIRAEIGESDVEIERVCSDGVLLDDVPLTIPLTDSYRAGTRYTLLVNDVAVQFDPADLSEGAILALAPQQLFEGFVSDVDFTIIENNTVQLDFVVEFANGCDVEPQIFVSPKDEDGISTIDLIVLQERDIPCPRINRVLEQSVDTGLSADDAHTFELQSRLRYVYSPDTEPRLTGLQPEMVNINEVNIEQTADDTLEYTMTILGNFTGCAAQTDILEFARGRLLILDVVHYAPMDIDCEGESFTVEESITFQPNGIAAINVNGITYPLGDAGNDSLDHLDNLGNDDGQGRFEMDLVIEAVQVEVLESFPMQLSLRVTGYAQDGCEVPIVVEQSVTQNTVDIRIYREMNAAMTCLAVVVPYEESIMVDGTFEGGTVTITVNEQTVTVDL